MVMRIEQHLVALQQIGTQDEGTAVAELEVGNLQFGAGAADDGVVFASIELKGLAGRKLEGHERMTAGSTIGCLLLLTPLACKGGDPVVGTCVTQLHQIPMQLPNGTSLIAMTFRLSEQPVGQGLLVSIQLGWAIALEVTRLHHAAGQVLADCIAGQPCPSCYLPYRHPFTEMPPSNHT